MAIPDKEIINKAVEDELHSILGNSAQKKRDKGGYIQTCLRLVYMRGWIDGQEQIAEESLKKVGIK